jgi:hypothetical protein
LVLLRGLEAAPAPLALSGFVFPGIGATGFMTDNIIDNDHVTGVTLHCSVFRHRINIASFKLPACLG